MNQEKIGKLIATLRKQKGLTQGELGAKVGVGDRAVSKWERGITCPDISIINELSSILGITSDELLKGELNNKELIDNSKPKFNKKLLLLIPIFIFAIGIALFIINRNKSEVYHLISMDSKYVVDGKAVFKNNKIYVVIDKVIFKDKDIAETQIQSYEYNVRSNNEFLYRYGYVDEHNMLESIITIEEFTKTTKFSFENDINISSKDIVANGLVLKFTFKDINNIIFNQEIKLKLTIDK